MTERLRIATFNLENLGDEDDGPVLARRIAVLRPQLLRLRADILCLQEVNGRRDAMHGGRRLPALDSLLAGTAYADFARVVTEGEAGHGPRDRHNQVILSRFPVTATRQIRHDFIGRPLIPRGVEPGSETVEWDRPVLHAALRLPGGTGIHLLNVHLRAPRAAFIAGAKESAERWRTMPLWAEGFFLAAVKRTGQATEARLFIDRLLDADPQALIAVCGDFNADDHEMPLRLVLGAEEDTGNPTLAARALVALERGIAQSQRFSVIHHGRKQMVDHLLVSQPLLAWFRHIEIHNEALGDELIGPASVPEGPASYHAPVVGEFESP